MTIKEVSEKYDISQDTLRYYERVGMIPPVTRTPGGIRNYQDSDTQWVELVKCMRSAGLTVESLIEYVRLYQEGDKTFPQDSSCLESREFSFRNRWGRYSRLLTGWTIKSQSTKLPWKLAY